MAPPHSSALDSMRKRAAESERLDAIMTAISAYLNSHPDASDTLAGIGDGWLNDSAGHSPDDVARALDKLVAQGRIEKQALPNGELVYRRSHAG